MKNYKFRKNIFYLSIFILSSCGGPEWLLAYDGPEMSRFVDISSISKKDNLVQATFLSEYNYPFINPHFTQEHWSSIMTVRIDCVQLIWALIDIEIYSKEGQLLEKKYFDGITMFNIPPTSIAAEIARRVCSFSLGEDDSLLLPVVD